MGAYPGVGACLGHYSNDMHAMWIIVPCPVLQGYSVHVLICNLSVSYLSWFLLCPRLSLKTLHSKGLAYTVNREYFVSKIFHAIIFCVK